MGQPTLDEIYALPDPMLNDNFDLHGIGGGAGGKFVFPEFFRHNVDAFQHLRLTCHGAHWRQAAEGKTHTLHLSFHDIQGDQLYLDAMAAFNANLGQLTLQQYSQMGKAVRQVVFTDLEFFSAVQTRNAADGKPAERVVTFNFESAKEISLIA